MNRKLVAGFLFALVAGLAISASMATHKAKADAGGCSYSNFGGKWYVYAAGLYRYSDGSLDGDAKLAQIAKDLAQAGVCKF